MIVFNQVHKTYARQLGEKAGHHALQGVSFRLGAGETLGMIGPNGAGKSTCIRLMMGFMRPSAGDIEVLAQKPENPDMRRDIGYLPETANFPQNLTCMDMLRFAGDSCGMASAATAEAAERWLTRLGLWESRNRLLRGFSKGMQQRASFAMALLHDPKLLILDEPMSGLDPVGRADIVALIDELRGAGKSILFCSHLLDDVERLVDRVLVLHRGLVRFEGELPDLRDRVQGWHVSLQSGERRTIADRQQLESLLQTSSDTIVEVAPASLEEAFLHVISEKEETNDA